MEPRSPIEQSDIIIILGTWHNDELHILLQEATHGLNRIILYFWRTMHRMAATAVAT